MAQISKKMIFPFDAVVKSSLAFFIISGLLLFFTMPSMAQNSDPATSAAIDRQLHEFSESIMSPYCPGMTLSGCPSPDARTLREEVRERLGKGETQQSIRQSLVERFGPELSGLPASTGTAKAAYGIPWLMVGLGVVGALLLIRIGRRKGSAGTSPAQDDFDGADVKGGDLVIADPGSESKSAVSADDALLEVYSEIDAEVSRRLAQGK